MKAMARSGLACSAQISKDSPRSITMHGGRGFPTGSWVLLSALGSTLRTCTSLVHGKVHDGQAIFREAVTHLRAADDGIDQNVPWGGRDQPCSRFCGALAVEATFCLECSARHVEFDGVLHTVVPAPRHLHHHLPCMLITPVDRLLCSGQHVNLNAFL